MVLMPNTNPNTSGKASISTCGIEKLNRTKYANNKENKQIPKSIKNMIHRGMLR